MIERDYKLFIKDINDSIGLIKKYISKVSQEEFEKNTELQDAVIRRLEIIGEAARRIPRAIKQNNPEIQWEKIINYRDFIVHSYFSASIIRIWNVLTLELDELKNKIDKIKFL